MTVTKTLPSILSKKDFDCWRNQPTELWGTQG